MTHFEPYAPPELPTRAGEVESTSDSAPVQSLAHPSFLGFLATQFLGAFNDNLYKQLVLLLAIPVAVAAVGDIGAVPEDQKAVASGPDLQGIATVVFGLPFVVFGGLAGYVSDRWGKRRIIVLSKAAEVVVMGLGVIAFLITPQIGFIGLWVVLFLMGLQSTFFGPGKYGILPELLPESLLSRANGLILMTTFVAIIIGTAVAGPLKDAIVAPGVAPMDAAAGLWIGSMVCVGIAVAGVLTSLLIVRVPAADPGLALRMESLWIPQPIRALLRQDTMLLLALLASCVFWLIAGLTIQSVNSLGKVQLGLSDTQTSLMVSLISVGIALGGVSAGALSKKMSDALILKIGMWGTVALSFLLSITIPGRGHLLGFAGGIPGLMLLGASAAFFAIPIQVFLQSRPPDALKGRMIALVNQANFFAIVLSGIMYQILDAMITTADWPRSVLFAAMGLLFLPVAMFYRLGDADHATTTQATS